MKTKVNAEWGQCVTCLNDIFMHETNCYLLSKLSELCPSIQSDLIKKIFIEKGTENYSTISPPQNFITIHKLNIRNIAKGYK